MLRVSTHFTTIRYQRFFRHGGIDTNVPMDGKFDKNYTLSQFDETICFSN